MPSLINARFDRIHEMFQVASKIKEVKMTYRMKVSHWMSLSDKLRNVGMEYLFKPGNNNGFIYEKDDVEGLEKFHIHTIEELDQRTDEMVFKRLLPKSSNSRVGQEIIDLATIDSEDWHAACRGMNSSTLRAVNALSAIFISYGLKQPA